MIFVIHLIMHLLHQNVSRFMDGALSVYGFLCYLPVHTVQSFSVMYTVFDVVGRVSLLCALY